jgi:hypothetical protein
MRKGLTMPTNSRLAKKITPLLVSLMFGSGFVLLLFFWGSNRLKQNNDFKRVFPPHFFSNKVTFDLGVNSFYFSGNTASGIFLGNSTVPGYLLRLDLSLIDTIECRINFRNDQLFKQADLEISVDSPTIYVFSPQQKMIWKSSNYLTDFNEIQTNQLQSINGLQALENHTMIIKSFDSTNKQRTLSSLSMSGKIITTHFLKTKGDGIFSTNGLLLTEKNSILYINNHWNGITRFDSVLNIIYQKTTIDGITSPKLEIINLKEEATLLLKGSTTPVNLHATLNQKYFMVHSGRVAKNENRMAFQNSWVIDTYSLSDGLYQFSFYIPQYENFKPGQFKLVGDILYVIYDRYLVGYSLALPMGLR